MKLQDLFSLKDQVAVVTGGGRGIGRFIATGLAEAGARLVIASRKEAKLQAAASELQQLGTKVITAQCDIGSESDIEALVAKTMDEFGRIDILVNNAGITWGAPTFDYPQEQWDKIINVNLRGVWMLTKKVGNIMKTQQRGKIIMITSIMGLRGAEEEVQPAIAYNASKGAIITLTKDLAIKWAPHNIHVNAIAPGYFATDMMRFLDSNPQAKAEAVARVPLKKMGTEDDIKGLAVFLASQASDYMTGQIIALDGGYTAR